MVIDVIPSLYCIRCYYCQPEPASAPSPPISAEHDLLVGVVDQLDGVGRALAGAGAAALALGRVDEGGAAQAANTKPAFLLDDLRNGERAGARAGQAADTFVGIDLGDHPAQVQRSPGESRVRARAAAARAWLMLSSMNFGIVSHAGQEDALAHEIHRAQLHLRFCEESLAGERHAQHLGQVAGAFAGAIDMLSGTRSAGSSSQRSRDRSRTRTRMRSSSLVEDIRRVRRQCSG